MQEGGSDSATLDNVLELLVLGGRSLPHAMMMMIPEATAGRAELSPELLGFYAYHQCLMEAWDGPAAVSFTDGRVIGATLDRNGLRPGRWLETRDGWVLLASETGVLDIPAENILRKGRLQPGKLFLVDLERGRIVPDEEIKGEIAGRKPYRAWFDREVVRLGDLPPSVPHALPTESLRQRQIAFGYSHEDMKVILAPLALNAEEAVSSMGNDTPLAVLSDRHRLIYSYFKQLFAQVTNPPIDSIREAIVMSLQASIGSEKNLFDETPEHARQLVLDTPVLLDSELEQLRQVHSAIFKARTLDMTWPVADGPAGMDTRSSGSAARPTRRSPRGSTSSSCPTAGSTPGVLRCRRCSRTAAVHHHLVREGTRLQAGLVVESGEARSVHSIATLIGYGAAAVNPYLMLETLGELVELGWLPEGMTADQASCGPSRALGKGLLKTLSKMGISTVPSYCGAQIFEAVGLSPRARGARISPAPPRASAASAPRPSRATCSPAMGVRVSRRRRDAPAGDRPLRVAPRRRAPPVEPGGDRAAAGRRAERAATRPSRSTRRPSTRTPSAGTRCAGCSASARRRRRIPLEEVEPASEIVKRFATGAMSLGSISREAHETLAIAMNRIGGRSNTGEGGEDPVRFTPDPNGDLRRSAIKQVASGRFGVTDRLPHERGRAADQDGAGREARRGRPAARPQGRPLHRERAPDDAGRRPHLAAAAPRHLLDRGPEAAHLRPPLREPEGARLASSSWPRSASARSRPASPRRTPTTCSSPGTTAAPARRRSRRIRFAGIPWEIGLAETQQTLVRNDLRSRIWVQTDGQLRRAATSSWRRCSVPTSAASRRRRSIASGCVMMRACHLNTCPVGIATQDPELRRRFAGQPEHVVNFFFYVAEEARRIMARARRPSLRGPRRPSRPASRSTTPSSSGRNAAST